MQRPEGKPGGPQCKSPPWIGCTREARFPPCVYGCDQQETVRNREVPHHAFPYSPSHIRPLFDFPSSLALPGSNFSWLMTWIVPELGDLISEALRRYSVVPSGTARHLTPFLAEREGFEPVFAVRRRHWGRVPRREACRDGLGSRGWRGWDRGGAAEQAAASRTA